MNFNPISPVYQHRHKGTRCFAIEIPNSANYTSTSVYHSPFAIYYPPFFIFSWPLGYFLHTCNPLLILSQLLPTTFSLALKDNPCHHLRQDIILLSSPSLTSLPLLGMELHLPHLLDAVFEVVSPHKLEDQYYHQCVAVSSLRLFGGKDVANLVEWAKHLLYTTPMYLSWDSLQLMDCLVILH